jgi:hypothetical protein
MVLVAADREEAITAWDAIQASAHRRGSLFSILGVHNWYGFTLLGRGDLTEAEEMIRQAFRDNAAWGIAGGPGAAYVYGLLADVLVERGALDEAEAVLASAPPIGGTSDGENFVRRARTGLHLAQGRTEQALSAAEDMAAHARYVTNPAYSAWRLAVGAGARPRRAHRPGARVGRPRTAVVRPGDEEFDQARQAFNLTVDQRPELVAYPADDHEVIALVRRARENGLRVAPQRTAHNAAPIDWERPALLLRTDAMQGVVIDAVNRTARGRAGALWMDLIDDASEMGLAALHARLATSGSPATRWAAAWAGWGASTASRPTASPRSSSSPPTVSSFGPTTRTSRSCSGPCGAAAATSAS